MRGRTAAKVLKNSVLKGAAGNGAAAALGRGVEAAGKVSATATELLRVHRDPAEVALRRKRSAIRRVKIWSAGTVLSGAGETALIVNSVTSGVMTSMVLSMIVVGAVLAWCLLGLFRAARDLRQRSRAVAGLPPPQPGRRPVASQIRAEIGRLDSYSDGLRRLTSVLTGQDSLAGVRDDVIVAADQAEVLLRQQAQKYTLLRRAAAGAPSPARPTLLATADAQAVRIREGVREYGRLVTAATDAVAASAELTGALADLRAPTERLSALAMGMREIAQHVGGAGTQI